MSKRCPFCAEEIQDAAIVCRFCNADLATNSRPAAAPNTYVVHPPPGPPAPSPGVAAVLSLFFPGVGQMYRGHVGEGFTWLVVVVLGYFMLILPGVVLHVICVVQAAKAAQPVTRQPLPIPIPKTPAQVKRDRWITIVILVLAAAMVSVLVITLLVNLLSI